MAKCFCLCLLDAIVVQQLSQVDVKVDFYKLGEFTPSSILHTSVFGTYIGGGLFTLQKRLEGDGILHVKSLKILYVMVFYM